MDIVLDAIETRVLGCLLEKELATPEYCPLTLNALVNACNQKSNRDPVLDLTEDEVARAVTSLTQQQLAIVSGEGGRATKYRHFLAEKLGLEPHAQAVLAELMVRGPQTPGELRTRASRMVDFPDVVTVIGVCLALEDRQPPLLATLPRQPGRKESRYAHLFAGMPEPDEAAPATPAMRTAVAAPSPDTLARLATLEAEVAELKAQVAEISRQLFGA